MRLCIVDPLGSPYDGSTPSKRALGGSESAVVFIARELVKLGHTVHVYCECEGLDAKPGTHDGVSYRPLDVLVGATQPYDVAVVSRSTRPFHDAVVQNAKHRVLWLHDTFVDGDNEVESLVVQNKIDEIWTLSDFHTSYITNCNHGHRRMMEVLKRKVWVTRNGVNVYRDVEIKAKDYNSFVFNAAVSKGMETLLERVWPRVHHQLPYAHLTIIGGAYPLKEADVQNKKLADLITKHSGVNAVTFAGLQPQSEVANILAKAAFMIYPQSHPETYGISTVESLAYGTPVISGRFGAMEETAIEDACYLMDYPVESNVLYTFNEEAHIQRFIDMVCLAHDDEYLWQQKANAALKVREVCGWDKVALQWEQHLFKKLGLYLPKEKYHEVQRINHRTHEIFNKRWSNPEEWAYYPEKEKMIHVIVPFYNASQYLNKCIDSIISQNYENYHVTLIDDASTDEPLKNVNFCKIPTYHTTYISNEKRVGALANQIKGIEFPNLICDDEDDTIIVLIDGDDALINDNNVFKKINRAYHDGAWMTYGSCWSEADNIPLIAQEYPSETFENKSFRNYHFPWKIPYTHLRTFHKELFNKIDKSLLKDEDGNFYKAGGDAALFYALIENCEKERVHVMRDVLYLYNDKNPINDYKVNSEEQTKTSKEVLAKPMPMEKKILIAIPTDRNIYPETFKSIYDLEIPEGYQVDFQYFHGYRVDQVRNLIADWTIRGYDYLFSVDYDISFPPDTLKKLLSHNRDLVSGLYIQRIPGVHNLELYRIESKENGAYHYRPSLWELNYVLEPIDGCGFGCVLVKKHVLEKIGYPQFEYHPALDHKDTISEDVDFCNKVRNAGFKMYADTTIKCGHHGSYTFEVNNDGI